MIEQPNLPIPSALPDPRQEAIAATVDELERLGVAQVTILVAGGLCSRRPSPREIGLLVPPEFRRRFRGRLIVHDAEADDLVELGTRGGTPLRVNPALVETDLVVTVTAAETVLHGGPAALLARVAARGAARGRARRRCSRRSSSQGWTLAVELERLLAARVPVYGVSLVLNLPRVFGGVPVRGADPGADRPRSKLRAASRSARAGRSRQRMIERVPRELTAAARARRHAVGAHAEALLRAIEFKGATLDEPLDAIVIGIPPTTPFLPRERPNPVSAAYLGLGLALRLWRNAFPVQPGGTAILLHDFPRRFPRADADAVPRALLRPAHGARPRRAPRGRAGRARRRRARSPTTAPAAPCHPLSRSSSGAPATRRCSRLGPVLIAGCRDALAARQLGFVPVHGLGAALAMARGRGAERIGFLLSPPYFPLVVGS